MYFIRRLLVLPLFIVLFQPLTLNAEIIDKVIAAIGDEAITLFDLEKEGAQIFRQIRLTSKGEERQEKINEARGKILDQLIDKVLLMREAERSDISADESRVTSAIDNVRKQNNLSLDELKLALKKDGMDYDTYREQVKGQVLRSSVIDRNVRADIDISNEDIRKYYEKNMKDFKSDEKVKARHILFMVPKDAGENDIVNIKKRAENVLKLAKKGNDFSDLAKKYSEGPSAPDGGDLGFFSRDAMVKEFSDRAFSLKEGEVSELVLTQFGFHIIKTEKKKGGDLLTFDAAKDKIKSKIYNDEMDKGIRDFLEELREKEEIDIFI